ncbi:MAG: hypothetical protein MUE60_15345, partial [Candidatus Eisenbacteria bacterium]|nr:hypothetical protein [Candidatus Eisenbacteria bacterium]
YNRRQGRIGHLFHGRYKASLVDVDRYLSALVRYIHLNPVRAGMVERPGDYRWSSHRFYVGDGAVPWLETGFVLRQFSEDEGDARRMSSWRGYRRQRWG